MQDYQKNNTPPSSDEIDLRTVFQGIGNFFKSIGNGIISGIIGIKKASSRYKFILLVFALTGGILGYLSYEVMKPYYETTMLIDSEFFKGSAIVETSIERLDKLASEENYKVLGKRLGISEENAKKIMKLEAEPMLNEEEKDRLRQAISELEKLEDKTAAEALKVQLEANSQSTYKIMARIYATDITEELEIGIKNFLKNNEYISKRMKITRENNQLMLKKLEQESGKLDSLKFQIFRSIASVSNRRDNGSNNVILSDANNTNAISVFQEDLGMYQKRLDLQRELFLNEDIEILEGFTAFKKPQSPSVLKTIVVGILLGLIASYLFIAFIEIGKGLSKIEKARERKLITAEKKEEVIL